MSKLIIRCDMSKDEIIETILSFNEEKAKEIKEVHFGKRPTQKLISNILTKFPNLEKITVPPSLYKGMSKRLLNALEKLCIKVEIEDRREKYSEDIIREIRKELRNGAKAKDIAEKYNIPLRTVYYLMDVDLRKRSKDVVDLLREQNERKEVEQTKVGIVDLLRKISNKRV